MDAIWREFVGLEEDEVLEEEEDLEEDEVLGRSGIKDRARVPYRDGGVLGIVDPAPVDAIGVPYSRDSLPAQPT